MTGKAGIGKRTRLVHCLWQMDYRKHLMLSDVVSAGCGDSLELWGGPWQITHVSEFRGLFVLVEIPTLLNVAQKVN